jgi:hypothetical protein
LLLAGIEWMMSFPLYGQAELRMETSTKIRQ